MRKFCRFIIAQTSKGNYGPNLIKCECFSCVFWVKFLMDWWIFLLSTFPTSFPWSEQNYSNPISSRSTQLPRSSVYLYFLFSYIFLSQQEFPISLKRVFFIGYDVLIHNNNRNMRLHSLAQEYLQNMFRSNCNLSFVTIQFKMNGAPCSMPILIQGKLIFEQMYWLLFCNLMRDFKKEGLESTVIFD